MANETKKTYGFSKKKAVELLTPVLDNTDLQLNENQKKAILAVFDSKSGGIGATTIVYVDGVVVGKRCSYFGVYMPINNFGKRGENYAYQCKAAESLVRKARTVAINDKNAVDSDLDNEVIDVATWRDKLAEIESAKDVRVSIADVEESLVYFETEAELIASL